MKLFASRRTFPLLWLAVGLSVFGGTSLLIQELAAQSGGQPNQDPAGTIDGSQTPELISREVAFQMIFRAFTAPANATSQQATIDEERMAAIGLSGNDAVAFKAILSDLLTKIQGLDVEAQVIHAANTTVRSGSHAWNQLGKLNDRRQSMIRDSLNSVAGRLTGEGVQKVEAFITQAKQKIKIYPGY